MKCLVKDCANHDHQGQFVGPLCSPCHTMLTTGEVKQGLTFIHRMHHALRPFAVIGSHSLPLPPNAELKIPLPIVDFRKAWVAYQGEIE